jgi:hypothetical protein
MTWNQTLEDREIKSELKFVWWPVRCAISNQIIWLRHAYRVIEIDWRSYWSRRRWHLPTYHITWTLRGRT